MSIGAGKFFADILLHKTALLWDCVKWIYIY